MRINKRKIGVLIIISLIISAPLSLGLKQDNISHFTKTDIINQDDTDSFEKNITYLMNKAHTPGLSACIVINDSVVWEKGYGYANIKKKINATENTIYLAASISKTITATAVMQLWEKGLFGLDDDVSNYLPFELKNPKYPDVNITFRMLLSHHSSLDYGDWKSEPLIYLLFSIFGSQKEKYEEILTPSGKFYNPRIWLDAKPGTKLQYSNIGFFILEYLVEIISNQSFVTYCKTNIFEPLQMDNTSYHLSNYQKDQLATPYIWFINTYLPIPNYEFVNYGVGGVRTSIHDLSHFLIANMNNGVYKGSRILKEGTIDMIRTIQFPNNQPDNLWYQYGLGWRIMVRNGSYSLWHPGTGPGVATYINYNPSADVGLIFFVNEYPIIIPYDINSWMDILYELYDKAYSYID